MARILVVDDEKSIRLTFSKILEREGYTVETAEDFSTAIEAMERSSFDTVLVDIILPRTSGIDLLKFIRDSSPLIPVIMITGEPNLKTSTEAIRYGAYDYISKPIVKEELLRIVARATEKKRILDEKERLEEENRKYREELEQKVEERTGELERRNQELATLNSIISTANQTLNIHDTLNRALEQMVNLYRSNPILIYFLENEGGELKPMAHVGLTPEEIQYITYCRLRGRSNRDEKGLQFQDTNRVGTCPFNRRDRLLSPEKIDHCRDIPIRTRTGVIGGICIAPQPGVGLSIQIKNDDFILTLADQMAIAMENLRLYEHLSQEVIFLKNEVRGKYSFENIIGKSKGMQEVFHTMSKVIPSSVTVMLRGESGTGKDLIAKAIHYSGERRDKRFVAQNCAAIPESILESELFGHKKGAFTGAVMDKKGLFEVTDGGTIFLDEVGDTSLSVQAKLLRVLEDDEIRRLGDTEPRKVNVRIISATSKDLEKEMREGRFRSELYYRLNIITIIIPPLRDRKDDIPLLADHFLKKICESSKKSISGFSRRAMNLLMEYPWPGNVRQLENEIERAVTLADNNGIIDTHLFSDSLGKADISIDNPRLKGERFKNRLNNFKKRLIIDCLQETGNNKTRAADILGMPRPNLIRIIKRLGIKDI